MGNMITRIIHEDSKVYYRLKDLKALFNCSDYKIKKAIKTAQIETHKLDFGRTLFIKEEDICKLDINNYKVSMRTTFKDLHDEIKSHYGMNQLLDRMFPAIKKSEVELQNKAIEDANNSLDSVNREPKIIEADEYMEVFNNVAKEMGFAERIHKIKMLCNNEKEVNEFMLINKNGNIIAEAGDHFFTIESFEESIREGRFVTNTEENFYIELKKGNPHKVKNENELLEKLHNLALNSKYEKSTVDYSYMTLPNGVDYSISIEFLHALYFNRLVILKNYFEENLLNELNTDSSYYNFLECDNEIVDVEYIEVLDDVI